MISDAYLNTIQNNVFSMLHSSEAVKYHTLFCDCNVHCGTVLKNMILNSEGIKQLDFYGNTLH